MLVLKCYVTGPATQLSGSPRQTNNGVSGGGAQKTFQVRWDSLQRTTLSPGWGDVRRRYHRTTGGRTLQTAPWRRLNDCRLPSLHLVGCRSLQQMKCDQIILNIIIFLKIYLFLFRINLHKIIINGCNLLILPLKIISIN